MPWEDYENLTDEYYDALPPLVPKGADREAILSEVVEKWATQTGDLIERSPSLLSELKKLETHSATLKGIALRDDHDGAEPIDLGDLLRQVEERLGPPAGSSEATPPHPRCVVALLGCDIPVTDAESLETTAHLFAVGSRFQNAVFSNAKFTGDADFSNATFNGDAYFDDATFNGHAGFSNATFNGYAYFDDATFNSAVDFSDAGPISFHAADFRRARVQSSGIPLDRISSRSKRFRLRCTDWLTWEMVQQLGGLQVLTRASYWALVIVPLVAAVWPLEQFIRDLFGAPATQSGVMALSWVLLYLAALCVFFGQLVYQLACPETIKQKSVEKLIEDAEEKTRQDKGISDERLRTAIDALQSVAAEIPHKHNAWLVTRSRRTVWLPHELELYKDHPEIPNPNAKPAGEYGEDEIVEPELIPAKQEISAEDRKRIAIEEGERAQWAMQAYRNRFAAWLSGGFYILGGWFVAAILLMQAAAVADAAGSDGLKNLIDTYRDPVLWWGSWGLLVAVILSIAMASDTPWEKLSRWFKGVWTWLQALQKWFAGKDKPKH